MKQFPNNYNRTAPYETKTGGIFRMFRSAHLNKHFAFFLQIYTDAGKIQSVGVFFN